MKQIIDYLPEKKHNSPNMSLYLKNSEFLRPEQPPLLASISRDALTGMDLYTVSDHYHEFEELVAISDGEGIHRIDGVDYPVSRGDIFVIKKGHRHHFTERRNMEHINILFVRAELPLPRSYLIHMPGYHALFLVDPGHRKSGSSVSHLRLGERDFATFRNHVEAMLLAQEEMDEFSSMILLTRFQEIILLLAQSYVNNTAPEVRKLMREARVVAYLESHYNEKISLEKLCEQGRMSRSTLMRRFMGATGKSPIQYLNDIRIDRSRELLAKTDASLVQIADKVGFGDSNYFSRQFKKNTGMSPREYRNKSEKKKS